MKQRIEKVLLLGSGALKIGEAGEFDYSGSQAIKALKEENIRIVLINPNIATVQTSKDMADKIYFLPVTPYFVEKVIAKERPDGILLSFGGQTALNCGVKLFENGTLGKYDVKVLGTPIKTIMNTEDRDLFVRELVSIGLKVPKSIAVNSTKDALAAVDKIKFPIMLRAAYTLGGQGSGVARDKKELSSLADVALAYTNQILIEEYLGGWKEVEYEVVRDCHDNCITVCNMENFDPLGIHTGESIVVAPSQTLTDSEYHKLREISIKAIRHLGVIGECNIQFALDPNSEDYRIIEVNARLSRSSALASKATGYPLAFIAAKLALGYSLLEIQNSITKKTRACFEPALDYIIVKIPRWDLKKFDKVSNRIGSGMKSVGEVMAIGRKFEEVLQKAIRMMNIGMNGVVCNRIHIDDVKDEIAHPTDNRIFAVVQGIKEGMTIDEVHKLSGIDSWFLYKIKKIIDTEAEIEKSNLTALPDDLLRYAKRLGFSDRQIGLITKTSEIEARKRRLQSGIAPVVKQIDTLAAEYPARTNYLYLTYNGSRDDICFGNGKQIITLGSGAYRIGSSVEFDWCCVNTVQTLAKMGYETIMINYNPETVSTDYDICDKLYFDELSFETVTDIYEKERPMGVIISMGGQIPNNLVMPLHKIGIRILGTSPESIDQAEDRHKFSQMLDDLGIDQPEWRELTNIKETRGFAHKMGYPVLIRPSYVLSGAAMSVALNDEDLVNYLKKASDVSPEHPVVISKFVTGAKEIEIDAVAHKGKLVIWAISEHVENAGVHSGDATLVLPPQTTYLETMRRIKHVTKQIAKKLCISGPFNIQFIAKNNEIKVIECNLRASRSFPFVSKICKTNFVELATYSILGIEPKADKQTLDLDYVGVKAPQFSFSRLTGADPVLNVEMTSTGEVACLGTDFEESFLFSLLSAGFKLPKKNVFLTISGDDSRYRFLESARTLKRLGFRIFATDNTSKFLENNGIECELVQKVHKSKKDNALTMLQRREFDLVICISKIHDKKSMEDTYLLRRSAVDFAIPLITNLQIAETLVQSLAKKNLDNLEIKAWDEY